MKMTTQAFCLKLHLPSTGIPLKLQAVNLGIELIFQCLHQLSIKDSKCKKGVADKPIDSHQDKLLIQELDLKTLMLKWEDKIFKGK